MLEKGLFVSRFLSKVNGRFKPYFSQNALAGLARQGLQGELFSPAFSRGPIEASVARKAVFSVHWRFPRRLAGAPLKLMKKRSIGLMLATFSPAFSRGPIEA